MRKKEKKMKEIEGGESDKNRWKIRGGKERD
jgi:hypothetical protein